MPVEVISSLRHRCTSCGGSCQGAFAYLLNDEERERVVALGVQLGVSNPIEDGHLRQHLGRCAFLAPDGLCTIHRDVSFEAKPVVCKQYPVVAVRTESGVRVGIDPGCYSVMETMNTAPEVNNPNLMAHRMPIPASQVPWERAFLDRTQQPGVDVASCLQILTGAAPDHTGLSVGWATRAIVCLQQSDLALLLDLPDTPPVMRAALAPVAGAIDSWSPKRPPPWPVLDVASEAYAVDVVRRMVHLRLAAESIPVAPGVALLTTLGIVAAAWADPSPPAFSAAVAAWCRGIRVRDFWMSIVPDASAMQRLATGDPAS